MYPAFACFGYGSLVNADTRHPRESRTVDARLIGWRREWRAVARLDGPSVCALSIRPSAGSVIDGVLVIEPLRKLPQLDIREGWYDRLPVARNRLQVLRSDGLEPASQNALIVYRAKRRHAIWGHALAPMRQSYVDVVMKGFLDRFGEQGLKRFMATTDGFDIVPIEQDRAAPKYPRAVATSAEEKSLFDRLLKEVGARWI